MLLKLEILDRKRVVDELLPAVNAHLLIDVLCMGVNRIGRYPEYVRDLLAAVAQEKLFENIVLSRSETA